MKNDLPESALHIDHVTVSYGLPNGQTVQAVRGVSLELHPGETLGLVGESGCGKSSLSRALVGLEALSGGSASFHGLTLSPTTSPAVLKQWRKGVQLVFQDPYSSLNPRIRIGAALDEVLAVHTGLNRNARAEKVAEQLKTVGLPPEAAGRYPHQFSGGQRQRIGIARALAVGAPMLILDEPVSALDVSVQAQIINLLRDIQQREGLGYLFVSHDLGVVEHLSDTLAVMYLGQIVEQGPAKKVCRSPRHPYTQALISAVPTPTRGLNENYRPLIGDPPSPLAPPTGCAFHPRCPLAKEQCKREAPLLREIVPGHRCACFIA